SVAGKLCNSVLMDNLQNRVLMDKPGNRVLMNKLQLQKNKEST
ncbi:unnamed protein product, partial [Urochloa humidicola]